MLLGRAAIPRCSAWVLTSRSLVNAGTTQIDVAGASSAPLQNLYPNTLDQAIGRADPSFMTLVLLHRQKPLEKEPSASLSSRALVRYRTRTSGPHGARVLAYRSAPDLPIWLGAQRTPASDTERQTRLSDRLSRTSTLLCFRILGGIAQCFLNGCQTVWATFIGKIPQSTKSSRSSSRP